MWPLMIVAFSAAMLAGMAVLNQGVMLKLSQSAVEIDAALILNVHEGHLRTSGKNRIVSGGLANQLGKDVPLWYQPGSNQPSGSNVICTYTTNPLVAKKESIKSVLVATSRNSSLCVGEAIRGRFAPNGAVGTGCDMFRSGSKYPELQRLLFHRGVPESALVVCQRAD